MYSRVTDLERRNQRLEKKVAKLKRRKKELKQEVAKLRGKALFERSGEAEELTGQDEGDVEVVEMEEENLCSASRRSNIEDENVDTNSNADFADDRAEVEENQRNGSGGFVNEEEPAGRSVVSSNEEHDDEAVDQTSLKVIGA